MRNALLFFLAGLVLFAPFRTRYVYHWDGGQFALAVRDYDVRLSQPHPPGYPLYVALGKLVNVVVGDPHVALVWLSVVCGAALVAVLYRLGTELFGERAGLAAGLFALTSQQFWFHAGVALMYIVDALAVTSLVWFCWRAIQRGGSWRDAVLIGGVVAVVGGIRPQTVPPLCGVLAYVFWQFHRQSLAKLAGAAVVAATGALGWLVPVVRSAGGWADFLEILRRYAANFAPVTFSGGGWPALVDNVVAAGVYCWIGLLGAAALVVVALVRREGGEGKRLLAWWLVPFLVAGTVISFTTQPGYVLTYVPALVLLAGLGAVRGWLIVAVTVINVLAFLGVPVEWRGMLFNVGRTAHEMREHDKQLERTLAALRANFDPHDTVLLHAVEVYLFGIRHFQVHAPEFEQFQLQTDPTMLTPECCAKWRVQEGRLGFVPAVILGTRQHVVLVVPPGESVDLFRKYLSWSAARTVAGAEGTLIEVTGVEMVGVQ